VSAKTSGLAQSVQVRLLAHAKRIGVDPNMILIRFATERYLYRLSRSPHADRFVLKGALLMLVWLGEAIRPTRDADLLGLGELPDETLVEIFREVCSAGVEPDGVEFLPDSVTVAVIREADPYGGRRVIIAGRLGSARLRVQVDVGIGDAVTPAAEWLDYPSLLDFPRPRLRAYRRETSIAEKLQTMVALGSKNSRMRDFFDVFALAEREAFDGRQLTASVRSTFKRRRTAIPETLPLALTADFAAIPEKQAQWAGFLRKNRLTNAPRELAPVIERLAGFLGPILEAVRGRQDPPARWPAGGPWQATELPARQRRKPSRPQST
jgi:predicted nucleotidyltransferase component of viral defense system